jgi:hypothetical protein
MKTCSKCKIQKPFDAFGKHKPYRGAYKDGLRYQCKACEYAIAAEKRLTPEAQAKRKAYRQRPEVKAKDREYMRLRLAKPEYLLIHRERSRNFVSSPENREKARVANTRYAKEHPNGHYARMASDPVYRLSSKIKRLFNAQLKNKKLSKTHPTQQILGCDYEFFHLYLEMQFTAEMNWGNFGEWQIDHKIAVASASNVQELNVLNHFSNLQPMWGKYNNIKNNKSPTEWAQYIKLNNINTGVRP